MSDPLEFDILPDGASFQTSHSRRSIVTSLRSKTSRLFGRNASIASTADNISQPVQTSPVKTRRSWFDSVGARFHRHDRAVLGSCESDQYLHVKLEDATRTANLPSSSERSPSRSPTSRGLFGTRRARLRSLSGFRRSSASRLRRTSSSVSDKGKENPFPPAAQADRSAKATSTGSWSSFRSGVQRAVRGERRRLQRYLVLSSAVDTKKRPEMVDSNFRFPDDRSARKPSHRVPLGTLWTIMSADSSEGSNNATDKPNRAISPSEQNGGRKPCRNSDWSPDWSPTSPNYVLVSPSTDGNHDETNANNMKDKEAVDGSAASTLSPTCSSPTSMSSPTSIALQDTLDEIAAIGKGCGLAHGCETEASLLVNPFDKHGGGVRELRHTLRREAGESHGSCESGSEALTSPASEAGSCKRLLESSVDEENDSTAVFQEDVDVNGDKNESEKRKVEKAVPGNGMTLTEGTKPRVVSSPTVMTV